MEHAKDRQLFDYFPGNYFSFSFFFLFFSFPVFVIIIFNRTRFQFRDTILLLKSLDFAIFSLKFTKEGKLLYASFLNTFLFYK